MSDTPLPSPVAAPAPRKHPAYGRAGRAGGPAGGLTAADALADRRFVDALADIAAYMLRRMGAE